jgi:dolichol-phosphate mannosyltransferase
MMGQLGWALVEISGEYGTGTRSESTEVVIGKEADLMSSIRRDRAHSHFPPEGSFQGRVSGEDFGRGHTLSIVIPAKDEAGNLAQLVDEVVQAFRPLLVRSLGRHRLDAYEVIVVDDGSTDDTRLVLERLTESYPELKPIYLAKNAGQSAATIAGFRAARGSWVGVLDADLQNPPNDLTKLWDALPGFDAALGWRTTREDCCSKRMISRIANQVRNFVLGQSIKDTGCSVRIFRREMALRLPSFHGVHRFLGPLLLREGCRVVQVPVSHRPRSRGKSHYHFRNRSIRVVVDLLGVTWLLRRAIRFEVIPTTESSIQPWDRSIVVQREEVQ